MFVRTTSINKLLKLDKFIKGVQGGSSAGKTFGIIPIEIDYATKHPNTEISIVAESIPHLKRGAIKDFKKIMMSTGRWFENRWNATDFKYTFANGSYIEFFSADIDSKLRGARRDRLYINECNNVSFHAYTELAMRTKQSVFLDWNPTREFWFHAELMNDTNVDYITLTYKDNEAAPKTAIDFIERAKEKAKTSDYWDNWYRVYGLGEIGQVQGTIFTNWHQIDNVPQEAKYIGIGLDFGYSNDPTAIVMVYKWNNEFILDEIAYQKELSNKAIADILKPYGGLVVCDSAEPKSIADLRSYGINATPCVKGKDSIINGIQKIQALERIHITKRSTNLIKEFRGYVWKTDRNGTALNEPIDFLNHGVDAIRYILSHVIVSPNYGKYHLR
jgi:phage terminase large subunit